MDPAEGDEVVLVLDVEDLFLVDRLAGVRVALLLGHDDVRYSESVLGLREGGREGRGGREGVSEGGREGGRYMLTHGTTLTKALHRAYNLVSSRSGDHKQRC